jgi:hypothetical protein
MRFICTLARIGLVVVRLTALGLIFFPPAQIVQAGVIHVHSGASTNAVQDGLSWTTAMATVQAGIDSAAAGDEVWVAGGRYRENLLLQNGVAIYGGFGGSESGLEQRNWTNHPTILDGQESGAVVTIEDGADPGTRIDGFTITGGSTTTGGGIRCSNSSPTLARLLFLRNVATSQGGAI